MHFIQCISRCEFQNLPYMENQILGNYEKSLTPSIISFNCKLIPEMHDKTSFLHIVVFLITIPIE